MKKKLIFMLVFMLLSLTCFAQNRSTLDYLTDQRWASDDFAGEDIVSYTKKYSDRSCKVRVVYDDGEIDEEIFEYYLSTTYEKKFDESKIGKIKYGDHLMVRTENSILCFRILKLNEKEFEFEPRRYPGFEYMGGGITKFYPAPK